MKPKYSALNLWKIFSNTIWGVGGVFDWLTYLFKQSLYKPYKLLLRSQPSWSISQQDGEEVEQVCSSMKKHGFFIPNEAMQSIDVVARKMVTVYPEPNK